MVHSGGQHLLFTYLEETKNMEIKILKEKISNITELERTIHGNIYHKLVDRVCGQKAVLRRMGVDSVYIRSSKYMTP